MIALGLLFIVSLENMQNQQYSFGANHHWNGSITHMSIAVGEADLQQPAWGDMSLDNS